MLKVLMADDEFLVRLAFTNTVNWLDNGFSFVGAAGNGIEAYEMILKEQPDIVITDLTMPLMSGLELIKKIQKSGLKCEFIVLSCHNEFEYVKEALKLGVFDYMLKLSMNMNELMDILERLKIKILKECPERMLQEGKPEDENLSSAEFRVIVIEAGSTDSDLKEKKHKQIIGFLQHRMGDIRNKSIFIYREIPTLLIWEPITDLESLLKQMQNEILKYTGSSIQIGVGSVIQGNANIRQSYEEAMSSYRHRFYAGEEAICFFERINYDNSKIDFEHVFPDILEALRFPLNRELKEVIQSAFQRVRVNGTIEPDLLRTCLHELCTRIKLKVSEQRGANFCGSFFREICQKIHRLEFINEIQDEVLFFLDAMMEETALDKENEIVRRVKNYIQTKWNEDLRVMEVSRLLGVNADYLSHLFHMETGMKYIDYVNHVRVDHACTLLIHTNARIYEVAEQSGFENTNYFIKVFRKITGMTPQEYRRNQEKLLHT